MPPYKSLLTDEYKTFKEKFGIVSFIIPNNLKVTTYTEQNFNGILGGPYTGPLHVPQANWYKIWSLKIESLLSNPDDDESDEGDEEGTGKKSESQKNNGKEEGNPMENITSKGVEMAYENEKEAVDKALLLQENVDPEMMNSKENEEAAGMNALGKEADMTKVKGLTTATKSVDESKEGHDGKEGGDRKENINNEMSSQAINAVDMYLAKGNMVRKICIKTVDSVIESLILLKSCSTYYKFYYIIVT